jgi:hypothetical protein
MEGKAKKEREKNFNADKAMQSPKKVWKPKKVEVVEEVSLQMMTWISLTLLSSRMVLHHRATWTSTWYTSCRPSSPQHERKCCLRLIGAWQ